MIGLEKVTGRIIEEAKDEAQKLILASQEKIAQTEAEADEKIRIIEENKDQEVAAEAENIVSRARSASEMQNRSIILEAKYRALDELFEAADAYICSLPGEEYLAFMLAQAAAAVKNAPDASSCVLSMNEKDSAAYGSVLAQKLSEKFAGVSFTLSQDCAKISGGVLMDFGDIDMDCSVKSVLAESRPSLEGELCKLLFESTKTK